MKKSSSSPFKIPVDLFPEIQLFLDAYDFWMLLASAKKLFEEVRFSTRTIKLTNSETTRFFHEPDYLRLILDKVQSPGRQLSLCVDRENELFFPVDEIIVNNNLKGVIPNWEQLFSLASKLTLTLNNDISELPFFPSLQTLKVHKYSKLSSLSSLSHLKKLFIRDCWEIRDVNCLRNLEELTIENSNITDVSQLGNIRSLTLASCYELQDISGLTNNFTLFVDEGTPITSVPSVFNSTILTINMEQVKTKKPSDFPRLKSLHLFGDQLKSFTAFSLCNLRSLEMFTVTGLKKLFPEMRTIPVIILDRCYNLEDISDLGDNKSVTIRYCQRISNFSSLKNVWKVLIESCNGFSDGKDVENVRHLTLYNYNRFTDLGHLNNVQHLVLFGSFGEVVEGIWSIPVLEVTELFAMKYFPSAEQNNEKIRISQVSSLLSEIMQYSRNYDVARYEKQIILFRKEVS
jgi:hypothetical protein